MSRFGPTVRPEDYTPDPDGLLDALLAYRQIKAQDRAAELAETQETRAAETHDINQSREGRAAETHEADLFESGFRRGPTPTIDEPVDVPRYRRSPDHYLGPMADEEDPLAGLRRTPRPEPGPEPDTRPFTPGQFIPGLGFTIAPPGSWGFDRPAPPSADTGMERAAPPSVDPGFERPDTRIGLQRTPQPTRSVPDPRYERVSDDLYRERPGPDPTYEILVAAGVHPIDALAGARDPVLARQLMGDRPQPGPSYDPATLKSAGLSDAEVAIVEADPDQIDNLLSLAERRRAAQERERRLSAGGAGPGGTRAPTPAQQRTTVLDAARGMLREMVQPEGMEIDDPDLVRVVTQSLATKFDVRPGDVHGVVSQAARDVRAEKEGQRPRLAPESLRRQLEEAFDFDNEAIDEELERLGYFVPGRAGPAASTGRADQPGTGSPAPQKSAQDRARELAAQGLGPAEIARRLTAEGYRR
jgi:hypothetical protein